MNLSIYKELTDDTLTALANRGLLRRAKNDLEATQPEMQEERADALVLLFAGESCTVTLPAAGPVKATCTCLADLCCRHILAGALWLRARAQEAPTEAAPTSAEDTAEPDELLQLTEANLISWAGRPLYQAALSQLIAGEIEVLQETQGKVRLFHIPQYSLTVRWIEGAGVDGLICPCKARPACLHTMAAIFSYREENGKPLPVQEQRAKGAEAGVPRTREEVLASVQQAITEMVALGIGRLSQTTQGRFVTLAISAQGVNFRNLNKRLRALSDHISWYLQRDVRASSSLLLHEAACTQILSIALSQPQGAANPALVGGRTQYFKLPPLDLVGVGAQQWSTHSGFSGLALFFWDVNGRRWTRWSDIRQTDLSNVRFYPQYRYQYEETWENTPAPLSMSRSRFRMQEGQRNMLGSLSTGKKCQVSGIEQIDLTAMNFEGVLYDDWSRLAERIAATRSSGLSEGAPLDNLVILTPAAWEEAHYDQMTQTLIRPVRDAAGRMLPLALAHNADWSFAVDTLQAWNPEQYETWGILGNAYITGNGLEVRPISLLNRKALPRPINSPVLHLTLDSLQANKPTTAAKPATPADATPASPASEAAEELEGELEDELAAEEAEIAADHSAVGRLLRTASTELEQLAERGARANPPALESRLRDLAERLRQVGLSLCAAALAAVVRHLEASRHQMSPETEQISLALLRAYYLLRLALEQSAVTEALAAYHS